MSKIQYGVIPAAGRGTRMGYLSHILPKCLFPIYDKPFIHANVEKMVDLGVKTIYIIVNYQKDKIKEYFELIENQIDAELKFIEQKKLLGIANAIMLTKEHINEPFMVMLADDCTIAESLQNLLSTFHEKRAIALEGVVKEENKEIIKATCCVKLNKNKQITEIIEKPKVPCSNIRGCGIYFFQNSIYDYIQRTPASRVRNEIEITDVIKLVATEKRAFGEFIKGSNMNINSCTDLWNASTLVWNLKKQKSNLYGNNTKNRC
ncbi:MAG: nucleotidyltransferase family protein [Candidatus Bathyarchaeota archaeon]|nr:nucleotidyltransferase family protein [Candidatus Bathyarchaeum tardum]WGM90339.1 MAG: nucleotidyltransferase family protein [Candidatus Bathyarchaeum tardum]WNZ29582.1 MAG: nucleotidyltransferase family protein [Candidatus Bathyarchaeota archaeon]